MALLPVEDAQARILRGVSPLPSEKIKLENAIGRVLAQPVAAKRDQPPFAASAMDGYAVRAEDVQQAPATLNLVGVSAAGHGFRGKITSGETVRILTGAPIPRGADAVVIQENVTVSGDKVTVSHPVTVGKNLRRQGLDFAAGELLVPQGRVVRPRDIGLMAAGNAAMITVHRRPRIALFATGDELVLPGKRPGASQIVSSNSHALQAMAEAMGAEVLNLGIIRDSLTETIRAVRKALKADVVLSTGGASVGDHDYVQEAFKRCGVKLDFWKIAMRPGKPFMYGRKGNSHVMGLPGNPVSALVTARLFLRPLLRAFSGLEAVEPLAQAELLSAMPANDSRQDYVRALLEVDADGRRRVKPFPEQDSSMQRTMQRAGALIVRPAYAPAAQAGTQVPVLLIDF
jgi:molybdopterin molybdotransferase